MLPASLIASLQTQPGFDREAFVSVHERGEQVVSIRVNPAKPAQLDASWSTSPVPWCPYGKHLSARPSFTMDPLLHAGAYYVQEASSMFLWYAMEQLVGTDTRQKVLDLCAAPGGKSSLLASYFSRGLVVANEVIKQRVSVLTENLTKWGSHHLVITNNDPAHFQSLPSFFDVMVVDAPCSGSGLFRKDPLAVEEWSENNVQLCSQRQQRILADALPALREGGLLVYSTCSYSPEEDETIADWLVQEMDMENCRIPLPEPWGIVETTSDRHHAFGYRFYPHLVRGEGLYISAFRKKKTDTGHGRSKKQSFTVASRAEQQQLHGFIPLPPEFTIIKSGDMLRALPVEWIDDIQTLAAALYLRKAGTAVGNSKGKDFVPAHELALSLLPTGHIPSITLNGDQALQYLKRKDMEPAGGKGWALVKYCGLSLGWVKVLPNRINNYYPAEWRILKE